MLPTPGERREGGGEGRGGVMGLNNNNVE